MSRKDKNPVWTISLLGEMSVSRGETACELRPMLKVLLAHLLLNAVLETKAWTRQALAEILWPESEKNRGNLRRHLKDLRTALGEGAERLFFHNADPLTIDVSLIALDIKTFHACCASGDEITLEAEVDSLIQAVILSDERLLSHFPKGEFFDYFTQQQERLDDYRREALRRLAAVYFDAEMDAEVVACARRFPGFSTQEDDFVLRCAYALISCGYLLEASEFVKHYEDHIDEVEGGRLDARLDTLLRCMGKRQAVPPCPFPRSPKLLPSLLAREAEVPSSLPQDTKHSAQVTSLEQTIQQRSQETRKATPHLRLPHINRSTLLDQITHSLRRALQSQTGTVVFCIGQAGEGKTVLLNDVYDAFASDEECCVGLLRCEELSLGEREEDWDRVMGQALTGQDRSASEVFTQLARAGKQPLLLLDTLDLLLSVAFVPRFGQLLRLWMSQLPMRLVLTCRSHDFADYLQPLTLRLAGIPTEQIPIPPFTSAEVKEAVQAYFRHSLLPEQEVEGNAFIQSILTLSADNRPLQQITHSPLLLALLCELYGSFGAPPGDLTVTGLYTTYWERKVLQERQPTVDERDRRRAARERIRLCFDVAETLFHASKERLRETLDEEVLGLDVYLPRTLAFRTLCSEHVLESDIRKRVRFFHQTFEEYAIACWLDSAQGEEAKEQLLREFQSGQASLLQHWWPTLRQYLTLTAEEEFLRWAQELSSVSPLAFRAVALATVSRKDATVVLERLRDEALLRDPNYQEALLLALDTAPGYFDSAVWQTLCLLLTHCPRDTAKKVAMQMGGRLRTALSVPERLEQALEAIRARPEISLPSQRENDRAEVTGKFLEYFWGKSPLPLPSPIFAVLVKQYAVFGEQGRVQFTILSLTGTRTAAERLNLLRAMLTCPLPTLLRDAATELLSEFLPHFAGEDIRGVWEWWQASLIQPPLPGWSVVYARVLGRQAVTVPWYVEQLLEQLRDGDQRAVGQATIALQEAGQKGDKAGILVAVAAALREEEFTSRHRTLQYIHDSLQGDFSSRARLSKRKQSLTDKSTPELLALARGGDIDAITLMIWRIHEEDAPTLRDMLPLLSHKKSGVAARAVEGLMSILEQGQDWTGAEMEAIAVAFHKATEATLVSRFCQLTGQWLRSTRVPHVPLMREVMAVPQRLQEAGTYDGGVARYVLETLGTLVTLENDDVKREVGEYLCVYWRVCDFSRVGNWRRVIKIVEQVMPLTPHCLEEIVQELRFRAEQNKLWEENVKAIVEVLWRIEGPSSTLLWELWQSDWCPNSAKALIADRLGLR